MPGRRLPFLLVACMLGSPALATVAFDTFVLRTGFEDAVCPNGRTEDAETCDDNGDAGGDGCSAGCRVEFGYYCDGTPSICVTLCGDGAPAGEEQCDDSGIADGDGCSAQCTIETGYMCTGVPSVCAPVCGDGIILPTEECDDGDPFDGNGCSAQCTVETGFQCSGVPSVCSGICGDGLVVSGEVCDDANQNACGTCSSDCLVVQSGIATGHIVATAANEIVDGEGFIINDGFQGTSFEFDFNGATQPGSAAVPLGAADAAGTVGTKIGAAINASALQLQADTTGSALVPLTHARATSLGNQPILESVSAPAFEVSGLAGGEGGDCPVGVGCAVGDDCASGVCDQGQCQ